jgi:hypothetical protein
MHVPSWRWDVLAGIVFMFQGILIVSILYAKNPSMTNQQIPVMNLISLGMPWNDNIVYTNQRLYTVYPVWMVFSFAIITGFFHFIAACRPGLQRSSLRWFEYSITSSIMILIISLMSGINILTTMISIWGNNMTMILCGFIIDMALPSNYAIARAAFWVGAFAGIFPWIAIFVSMGLIGGFVTLPPIVFCITILLFFLFMSFGVVEWWYMGKFTPNTKVVTNRVTTTEKTTLKKGEEKRTEDDENYASREWRYLFLSFTSKTLLIWLTAGAIVFV